MADPTSTPNDSLIDIVHRVLAEHGPLSEDELLDELDALGVELDDDPEPALEEALDEGDGRVALLADNRYAALPELLAGRVFTHRVTAEEATHDVLAMSPDLDPLIALDDNPTYQRLTDGSPVTSVFPPLDADVLTERGIPDDVLGDGFGLLLAPGTLPRLGVGAGDLLALRVTPTGLDAHLADEPTTDLDQLARVGKALIAVLEMGEPLEADVVVWTACAAEPALCREPLPPLGEVFEACGLARHGDWAAREGFDFGQWRIANRKHLIAHRHDLDDDEALAVLAVVTLYDQVADLLAAASDAGEEALAEFALPGTVAGEPGEPAAGRSTVATVIGALADPEIAEVVLAETLGADGDGAAALGLFAESLEPLAPREARPALRWLRGKAHERLGDIAEAEAAYLAAESLDPSWPPNLVDLARYVSDRGDAPRALALLRRANAPADHHLMELLQRFIPASRPGLGRNEPCWCGSGRKYKKCHLDREQVSLDERVDWLYQKASMVLAEAPWLDLVSEAAIERARYAETPQQRYAAVTDPLVSDAVLFEGGAFDEFAATRGALLPDDERLLAEQWLLIDRSVYEVGDIRAGHGFTARDLRTGDTHQVRERSASRQLSDGQLICARIVPAGDTTQIFGGIEPVGLHQRDELIELLDNDPDPLELIAFLTRRFAPPVLTNTEGDPLVFCEATLRVSDPATLAALLDETYDRDEDVDPPQWIEHVTTHGMERIRTMLRLDGDELSLHTNSEQRHERVLDTVRALDPTISVVSESRQPARDARQAAALAQRTPRPGTVPSLDPADPALAAALEQFARQYEQQWLDEPIPALAGKTPRQASNDPTRRDDLIRLLDSFPAADGNPGMMDPDRLRAALGL